QGKFDAAADACRRVVALRPDYAFAGCNLLLFMNYDERAAAAQIFDAHRVWAERYGRAVAPIEAHANDRDAGRRLKVGYVSPDFCNHSVAFFLEPLLRCHDRRRIEVFCYAEARRRDATTERLKGLADGGWLETVGISDASLAERIRSDGIDILV